MPSGLLFSCLRGVASTVVPTVSDKANSVTTSENGYYGFTGAGVRFDYVNKVYAKFGIASGAPAGDTVTVTVNGSEVSVSALGDGKYIAYSEDISALEFDKVLTFELKVNGSTVQTLTYSVNSYAYSKYDDGDAMGNLALALYRYGVSAAAYDENK